MRDAAWCGVARAWHGASTVCGVAQLRGRGPWRALAPQGHSQQAHLPNHTARLDHRHQQPQVQSLRSITGGWPRWPRWWPRALSQPLHTHRACNGRGQHAGWARPAVSCMRKNRCPGAADVPLTSLRLRFRCCCCCWLMTGEEFGGPAQQRMVGARVRPMRISRWHG